MNRDLLARITSDPNILCGKPIIRGLRISVEQILEALGGGVPAENLLADYPFLEPEDIQACLLYAATVLREVTELAIPTASPRP